MDDNNTDLLPATTPEETAANILAVVTSLVPWIGPPLSVVMAGVSVDRKLHRVRQVLMHMAEQIESVTTDAAEKYVNTEDFQDLLEKTLRKSAEERVEEKRLAYATFLANDIKSPSQSYDSSLRLLRTLEETQIGHIHMLRALLQEPDYSSITGSLGSVGRTLTRRLANMPGDTIGDLAQQLMDMRLANLNNLQTTTTARGAEELQHAVTSYGHLFIDSITSRP